MSRMVRTFLVTGACAVVLFSTGAVPATREKVNSGTAWLAWSAAEKEVYVRGFIFGYGNGSEAACKLADELFEVGKHHRLGEGPGARCENRVKQYTKIKILDSGFDFGAYTSVVTDFYTKHPEYQNVSETYLLSLLSDQDYKSADQLYQMVLKGAMTNHFPPALGFCWTPNCNENESEITRREPGTDGTFPDFLVTQKPFTRPNRRSTLIFDPSLQNT
jgi:hypothetical protein